MYWSQDIILYVGETRNEKSSEEAVSKTSQLDWTLRVRVERGHKFLAW